MGGFSKLLISVFRNSYCVAISGLLGIAITQTVFAQVTETREPEPEVREVVAGSVNIVEVDLPGGRAESGDPKLLTIQGIPGSNQIKVFPLKAGSTNLLILDNRGKVRKNIKYVITATDLSLKVENMRALLDNIEGITINSVGDKIVIDGELVVPKDLDRIINVSEAFGGAKGGVLNLVQISRVSQRVIGERIEAEIRKAPQAQNITVRVANDTFFLEGVVDSPADRVRAENIARTFVPEVLTSRSVADGILREVRKQAIRNEILVNEQPPPPPPKMIRTTFHFVELSKDYLKTSFLKWSPSLSSGAGIAFGQSQTGGVGATSGGTFSGTISNLIPRLQRATGGGYGRVLFSSVLISKDGTNVSVNRSDEIPFVVNAGTGSITTEKARAGVQISVTPTIVGNDSVELTKTEFEFSTLIGTGTSDPPRTKSTNLINTTIVRSGDSAVLGGLISSNMSLSADKDPESADGQAGAPLFTLLRSREFRNDKSQFLVFVTPQIIDDAAEGTADIKKKVIGNKTRRKRFYQ